MPHARALLIACLGAALLLAASCGEHMAFEVRTSSAGGYAGAGGTGGGSSKTGGASSGGSAGTGSKSGTGASTGGCTETCRGATPYCDAGECVACRDADDCKKADKPFCAESTKSCVECEEHESCTELSKPVCEAGSCTGCTESPECARFSETPVCDEASGTCVGCLTEADCDGKVCDPRTHECTEFEAHYMQACEACEYDAQCRVGQVCVEMTYHLPSPGVIGKFCLWEKATTGVGAPNGICGSTTVQPFAPFVQSANVTSVDGKATTVCQLATTTCPALLHHRQPVAGCNVAGDDDACGAAGFNDGLCRVDSEGDTRCTYRCGGDEDCDGFTCGTTPGDRYCSL